MNDEGLKVAVDWWADKLRGCKHSGLSAEERSDRRNDGYQMAEMLMTITKPKVTDEQIAKFSEHLLATLKAGNVQWLDVDYGPCGQLYDALVAAKIEPGMGTLPIKTSMWIDADKVSVRYGYGAPEKQIYPPA